MTETETFRPYAHVLAVQDLTSTTRYFQDQLGFRVDWSDADDWRMLTRGGVRFMIGRCPDTPPARDIGDHAYVAYLDVADIDAIHAEFAARGAIILQPPADRPWGMREMPVSTPDGHRFMFGQTIRR